MPPVVFLRPPYGDFHSPQPGTRRKAMAASRLAVRMVGEGKPGRRFDLSPSGGLNWSMRAICWAILIVLPLVAASGCGRAQRISAANDALRERILELEEQINQLVGRNAELQAEISRLSVAPETIPPEIIQATPHVTKITLGRLSHAADTNGDGLADLLRLYLHPEDGRGRFIQIVGSITAQAAILPSASQAVTIGQLTLDPMAVRDAYRSTFLGYYYTIELPIEVPAQFADDPTAQQAHVQVNYTDGYTGQTLTAERTVELDV